MDKNCLFSNKIKVIIIILGFTSVSASKDVIGDPSRLRVNHVMACIIGTKTRGKGASDGKMGQFPFYWAEKGG